MVFSFWISSSRDKAVNSSIFTFDSLILPACPGYEFSLKRQFIRAEPKASPRVLFGDAAQLKKDFAALDYGNPMIKIAFTLSHADFRRFLGNRVVRECPDPELAAFMQLAGKDHAHCFYLGILKPSVLKRLKPEFSECQLGAFCRDTSP